MSALKERIHNGLWAMAGMLLVGVVSTGIENKAAIASLDAKVVEVGELSQKMDKVIVQVADLSGRVGGMRNDIQRLEEAARNNEQDDGRRK